MASSRRGKERGNGARCRPRVAGNLGPAAGRIARRPEPAERSGRCRSHRTNHRRCRRGHRVRAQCRTARGTRPGETRCSAACRRNRCPRRCKGARFDHRRTTRPSPQGAHKPSPYPSRCHWCNIRPHRVWTGRKPHRCRRRSAGSCSQAPRPRRMSIRLRRRKTDRRDAGTRRRTVKNRSRRTGACTSSSGKPSLARRPSLAARGRRGSGKGKAEAPKYTRPGTGTRPPGWRRRRRSDHRQRARSSRSHDRHTAHGWPNGSKSEKDSGLRNCTRSRPRRRTRSRTWSSGAPRPTEE
jgi:hypothetical protein